VARLKRTAAGLLLATLACLACEQTPTTADAALADAGALDAGSARPDTGPALDAGGLDAAAPDAAPALSGVVRVTTTDGETHLGEVVATYDATGWWSPRPGFRLALFDSAAYAPFPADESLTVISSLDIVASTPSGWPDDRLGYRDDRRARGVVFDRSPLDEPAYVITAHEDYHLEENGYGDFAWDLVRTDASGRRFRELGATNEDYLVWDAPVFLPTAGVVFEVVADAPDNLPGDAPREAPSNLVGVRLAGGAMLYLLHFRQGSIAPEVVVGATLPQGAYLGRVGNSGVSLEPHLHVTALHWVEPEEAPPRFYSVPIEWKDVQVADAPDAPSRAVEYASPPSGVWVSSTPF